MSANIYAPGDHGNHRRSPRHPHISHTVRDACHINRNLRGATPEAKQFIKLLGLLFLEIACDSKNIEEGQRLDLLDAVYLLGGDAPLFVNKTRVKGDDRSTGYFDIAIGWNSVVEISANRYPEDGLWVRREGTVLYRKPDGSYFQDAGRFSEVLSIIATVIEHGGLNINEPKPTVRPSSTLQDLGS